MGLGRRLLAWLGFRRYRPVVRLETLAELEQDVELVAIEGRIEPLELLHDPITGRAGVAIGYRAWPPSTTIGMDGATAHNSRAFELQARQAVDFIVRSGAGGVLVQVDGGRDLAALHRELLGRYGVGLRAEAEVIAPGTWVHVKGRVLQHRQRGASPHRSEPYQAVVHAHHLWVEARTDDEDAL